MQEHATLSSAALVLFWHIGGTRCSSIRGLLPEIAKRSFALWEDGDMADDDAEEDYRLLVKKKAFRVRKYMEDETKMDSGKHHFGRLADGCEFCSTDVTQVGSTLVGWNVRTIHGTIGIFGPMMTLGVVQLPPHVMSRRTEFCES
jgi:hypothetical protein